MIAEDNIEYLEHGFRYLLLLSSIEKCIFCFTMDVNSNNSLRCICYRDVLHILWSIFNRDYKLDN